MVNSYPWPSEYYHGFEKESEYSDWLKSIFDKMNWRVRREVTSMTGQARADIIAAHRKWGTFGIECKPDLRPRNVADAIEKVNRYKEERFRGFSIDGWAIAVARRKCSLQGYDHEWPETDEYYVGRQSSWAAFAAQTVNCLGVGWLSHNGGMEIVFNESNPMIKIPVAAVSYPDGDIESYSLSKLQDRDRPQLKAYFDDDMKVETTTHARGTGTPLAKYMD